jgi:alpha,alpha-trehalose phosphorylase
LLVRGSRLQVDIDADGVGYTVTDGPGLTIRHYGERITLTTNETVTRPMTSVIGLAA